MNSGSGRSTRTMRPRNYRKSPESDSLPPTEARRLREERRERISHLRESHANEKVVLGLLLSAGIIASIAFANTLEIRSLKAAAGVLVACLAFPTVAMFILYEPVRGVIRSISETRRRRRS